ncbi:hypothetical protein IQ249_07680 [Lusitaniella coriacea LEGE 07157]|uniref:Uncharacterized protein n=1 Tax=Lusitaniella coriacea LEGE 07157 TaxID=945747 RepID=A0A8J7DVG3_9CYAN|nr:hypothetical protein [Lusitaniella coriacea]MBE9115769.1 hypothetical protein [Lusitaniella coriacea LEGE 07157]
MATRSRPLTQSLLKSTPKSARIWVSMLARSRNNAKRRFSVGEIRREK